MKHSYIQLHVAILLAACSSIFGKLISLDAVFITFYRMLLAAVILFVVVISTRRTSGIGKSARGNILTGVLLALHWIMFYASIKFANVSIGVVCFCLTHPSAWECCAESSHHCFLPSIPLSTPTYVFMGMQCWIRCCRWLEGRWLVAFFCLFIYVFQIRCRFFQVLQIFPFYCYWLWCVQSACVCCSTAHKNISAHLR